MFEKSNIVLVLNNFINEMFKKN